MGVGRHVVDDPVLAAAARVGERLLHRWGKPLNLSLEFLREDRTGSFLDYRR
jgi:hypothetical protein